jgi:hypothetical protein
MFIVFDIAACEGKHIEGQTKERVIEPIID